MHKTVACAPVIGHARDPLVQISSCYQSFFGLLIEAANAVSSLDVPAAQGPA
jgi:hypothetical protein